MNPLARVLGAIADRLHPGQDATDTAHGLVVEYRADGTRVVHHPDLPRLAAAHRARVLADPDPIDAALITPDVRALAAREADAQAATYLAAYLTKAPGIPPAHTVTSSTSTILAVRRGRSQAPPQVPSARARPLRPARH